MNVNSRIPPVRIAAALAVAWTLVCQSSAFPAAPAQPAGPGPNGLWLISTRQLPGCQPQAEGEPSYWFFAPDGTWVVADAKAFLASDDPSVPTVFFIHGNRFSSQDAVNTGWQIYQLLRGEAHPANVRFVIWSWPADRIPGRVRRDVQIKADRSDVESYWLADCVRRINPQVRVSLIGYSFGVRPIVGTFQLLAGGQYRGLSLPAPSGLSATASKWSGLSETGNESQKDSSTRLIKSASQSRIDSPTRPPNRVPMRAVFIAGAMDNTALWSGCSDGATLESVDRMLVTCNCADPALKYYRRIDRRRGPDAIGYTGPIVCGPDAAKLETLNVTCEVGRRHDAECYLAALSLRARLAFYAFQSATTQPITFAP